MQPHFPGAATPGVSPWPAREDVDSMFVWSSSVPPEAPWRGSRPSCLHPDGSQDAGQEACGFGTPLHQALSMCAHVCGCVYRVKACGLVGGGML